MEKVVLANGKEIKCLSFALASVGILFIRVDMTISQAAKLFSDPEKLSTIKYLTQDGKTYSISNYTELAYITNEGDCVRVALQQPVRIEEVQDGED